MSWEDQGRQDHGWFETGTGPGRDEGPARALNSENVARVVVAGVAAFLPGPLRSENSTCAQPQTSFVIRQGTCTAYPGREPVFLSRLT